MSWNETFHVTQDATALIYSGQESLKVVVNRYVWLNSPVTFPGRAANSMSLPSENR
ncbi:MAG TPA: hypothetical protein VHX38_07705 [Pseudonocardiaceae bacterium]|nr:hypothetical protein [Pseudonocardiaceae bacterium]